MPEKNKPLYQRILLKMSGEALMGVNGHGPIDPHVLDRLVREIAEVYHLGVQVAIVVGGGNFFRGVTFAKAGISRISADQIGMLATVMNALALRDAFDRAALPVCILSAIPVAGVAEHFHRHKAIDYLSQGKIVIFSAGTGNPLVTTDSAASLRAIEVSADILLKATDVDGIYTDDPAINKNATRYQRLSYQEALNKELAVMDLSAFCQCRDHHLPIRVFNINKPGMLFSVICSEQEGTLVNGGSQ